MPKVINIFRNASSAPCCFLTCMFLITLMTCVFKFTLKYAGVLEVLFLIFCQLVWSIISIELFGYFLAYCLHLSVIHYMGFWLHMNFYCIEYWIIHGLYYCQFYNLLFWGKNFTLTFLLRFYFLCCCFSIFILLCCLGFLLIQYFF